MKGGEINMAKQQASFLGIVAWLVGVLVSLSVGFGMIDGVLTVKWIPSVITVIAGWVVVIGTIISVIMALFGK